MFSLSRRLLTPPYFPALLALASALILLAALGFQHIGGYAPCILCYYQRAPFWLVIALCLFFILVQKSGRLSDPARLYLLLVVLCAIAFLGNAALAFYHMGVEYHYWPGPDVCAVMGQGAGNLEELFADIMKTKPVRCDEPAWTLFEISMAGYNFLLNLGLFAACILALRQQKQSGW